MYSDGRCGFHATADILMEEGEVWEENLSGDSQGPEMDVVPILEDVMPLAMVPMTLF